MWLGFIHAEIIGVLGFLIDFISVFGGVFVVNGGVGGINGVYGKVFIRFIHYFGAQNY